MTDITELAQSLKAAAEKSGIEQWVNNRGEVNTADYEVDGGVYIDHICDCEIIGTESPRAEFIALANPANILALVEALEKAQQYAKERDAENQDLMLTVGRLRVEREELESRTVKLPQRHSMLLREDFNEDYHTEMAYKADEVQASLAAAGIKVEAE